MRAHGDGTTTSNSPDGANPIHQAVLVGCRRRGDLPEQVSESLDELAHLVFTAGADAVHRITFDLRRVVAATLIGPGQVEILAEQSQLHGADFIVFDQDLSPTQQRNIEEKTELMVMDRTGMILDIFASRAQTREGKLQVELAQLEYLLPRLRGMWTHLSRQGAGIGTRGPGETVLEVDRRRIQEKIARLKRDLEKVKKTRALHRRARLAVPYPIAVLVGYTNAGKSTLLNRLTHAGVLVEDKLFATLDTTVRELRLDGGDRVLLADTVGFIRKLPHQLVASFSATFEEIAQADVLLHLVDVSHPMTEDHIHATRLVLSEIGVDQQRVLMVLNKADQIQMTGQRAQIARRYPDAVLVSAATGEGIDALLQALSVRLSAGRVQLEVLVPYTAKELLSKINKQAKILSSEYRDDGVHMKIETDKKLAHSLGEYRI